MPLSSSSSVICSDVTSVSPESTLALLVPISGLRLVDLDVFLQAMNEVFLKVAR
jgi:hypothetical protein